MQRVAIFLKRCWKIFRKVFLVLFIAQLVYTIALRWINPPVTVTQLISYFQGHGIHREFVPFDELPPDIKLAVIAAEDKSFLNHSGLDLKSIRKAYKQNKTQKKPLGASTISQQVAKNVFLWQGGGWFRKTLETYFTVLIEICWSKKRIMEVYLNVAETGKGLYGVEAAAQHYFGKSARGLTTPEAAQLAAALPNPKIYSVHPPSPYIIQQSNRIIVWMDELGQREKIKAFIAD